MRMQGTCLSILGTAVLLLSGCVTFTIPLPPQLGPSPLGLEAGHSSAKLNRRVLLVVSEELAQSQYSTSQALTRWEYPLGDALPRYIEESLGGVFTHVDRSTSDRLYSGYDLIVHSELLGFTAEVPWTIFSQTKTRIEIEYRVIDVAMGDEFVIAAVGTEEVVTTHDRKSHAKDVEVAPTLPTVATSASIGQHIGVGVSFSPKWYHYLAAADAQLAISHCLTELQRKLVAELQ